MARLWICEGYTGCWICLNMIEYVGIYLKKQSDEYTRITLNVSDAVHSIRSLYNLLSIDQQHCQTFKMERFTKRIMPECSYASRIFSGQERRRLWNLGTSINISSKTQEKEAPQGNILEFFFLGPLKTTFRMKNLTQWWAKSGPFFPKSGHFFRFSKKAGEASSLLLSCAPVSVASISINIPKYP